MISDSRMNDADQPVASIASTAEVLSFPSGTAHANTRSPNHSVAVRLAQAGFSVFPARVMLVEGTGRWDKVPLVRWRNMATTDLDQIEKWWAVYPDAVPGIELGRAGLMVIDADRHGGPDGVAALEALAAANAPLPLGPVTVTAGGGKHFIFRQPEGQRLGNGRGSLPSGVDVRGDGGWIVGPGAVRPDGAAWAGAPDAPALDRAFRDSNVPVVPAWIVALIQCKPQKNGDGGAKSSPNERGCAFAREALNGCVSELAAARQNRNNKANAIAYRMGRMVARGWITRADVIAELFGACDSNGLVQDSDVARVHATLRSGLDAGEEDPHEDLPDRDEHRHANDNIRQESTRSTSEIHVTWDGETKFKAATWLVRDLIPDQSIGLIVGESQSAKTFIAVRLAIATATGVSFFNKRTKRGGVAYVAAEAPGTIYDRIEAARLGQVLPDVEARKFDGIDAPFDPHHLPIAVLDTVPDLARDGGVTKLLKSLRRVATEMESRHGVPLRLVVIDTMLAAFALDNWNDAAQAAKTSSVLTQIKQELGVTALGLHHHGKDASRGAAGSFALTAGPDFVLSTFRTFDQSLGEASDRWLVLTKSRSGPTGWRCHFDLVAQKIGQDDEGDDVMGAFVRPMENGGAAIKPARKRKDSGSVSALRTAVEQALTEHGEPAPANGNGQPPISAVRTSHVRAAFEQGYKPRKAGLKNPTQARQKAFTRGLDEACRNGWLQQGVWDDAEWLWRLDS